METTGELPIEFRTIICDPVSAHALPRFLSKCPMSCDLMAVRTSVLVCCHSEVLYSTASLHVESQGRKQAASSGNASGDILRKLHTLLQEEAARPGEIKHLMRFLSSSLPHSQADSGRTEVMVAVSEIATHSSKFAAVAISWIPARIIARYWKRGEHR